MLCAQHALNSLLQGNYFTAPDLASIANAFDVLEHDALGPEAREGASSNMDDTGFFSVQVMDRALDVWGLNLVRWRSEQMRPFQAAPRTQLAFVLNLHQHWFTLRRFGSARTDPASDPGEGHWFNLNSQYPAPKWVSRTYLGMFLEQSEQEGYSVFAVVQADPDRELALPRTEADTVAMTLDAPDSAADHSSAAAPGGFSETPEIIIPDDADFDVDNEDFELQAALAASLGGADPSYGGHDAYVPRAPVPAPELRQAPPPPPAPAPRFLVDDEGDEGMDEDTAGAEADAPLDPVAASLARNRAMLARMQREQEAALRETYAEDAESANRAARRRAQLEEEAAAVREAIAASIAEGGGEGMDEDEDDEEWRPAGTRDPEGDKENAGEPAPGSGGASAPPAQRAPGPRVYDDEDAELQAALRASLESMPAGYTHPATPPAPPPTSAATDAPLAPAEDAEDDDAAERSSSPVPPPATVDVEEMRRRRLARFGG
ncbi:Josephin-domain-containing protein [Phellopilus nigrolimitatus]|nr:Josephin-domain-containing protein [Phellopilus nigrolimitatus]